VQDFRTRHFFLFFRLRVARRSFSTGRASYKSLGIGELEVASAKSGDELYVARRKEANRHKTTVVF